MSEETGLSGIKWTKKKRTGKVTFKKKTHSEEDEGSEVKRLLGSYKNIESTQIKTFKDFPLSKRTLQGLKESGYMKPTEIQRESIGLALRGLDILGAAQTGSGKTLAFIIPVIESLFTNLFTKQDGLGALIITPTRELAYQIFETLRKVGRKHDFSAGLVIGGKDLKFERKRLDQVNIMICTPGRLLQHMDENPMFDCNNLKILVLDEADRCLDLGFQQAMNAIIANLPPERQTLLFSATQTKSVKDLARLSLKSPAYVSVHENSKFSTPDTLQQNYVVMPLENKLDMLWSFLKHHKKSKILVFLSSCKQVRFVHMLFCRMRPGMSLLGLYGSLHQLKRMSVYEEFCKKQAVVLFATDIAARGLDFPEVDWVIQLDCPEDANTYIHRVGRTARYNKNGEALLVLLPTEEEGMLEELTQKRIPIDKIEVNPSKQMTVRRKFEALLARDLTLKECAQRAFKSYLKAVFLMKNKKVFDVSQVELPTFARSLGLAVAPRVRFIQKRLGQKGRSDEAEREAESDNAEDEKVVSISGSAPLKFSKSEPTFDFNAGDDEDNDELDDLFVGKKAITFEPDEELEAKIASGTTESKTSNKPKTKAKLAKKILKKKLKVNKVVNFDDEGLAVSDIRRERQSDLAKAYEKEDLPGINIETAKEVLKQEDIFDKQINRERVREKHREERKKEKLLRKGLTKEDLEGGDEDENGPRIPGKSKGKKNRKQESDEESDYEPDLSWLPDPDKLYGKSKDNDSGSEASEDDYVPESYLEATGQQRKNKRKSEPEPEPEFSGNPKKKAKKVKSFIDTDSIGNDAMEEFALKLLQK